MSAWVWLGVSVFGGLGAGTRYLQDSVINRFATRIPWATMSINVLGSFLFGLITGLAMFDGEPEPWRVVLGVGFCGGYTTFSTAMVEVVSLARQDRWRAAATNLVGTVVVSVFAVILGLWLASR